MNINETIDKRKAYIIIASTLVVILVLGVAIGKFVFWEKYDSRSSKAKDLERYQTEVLLNSEDVVARINLGWSYQQIGKVSEAKEEYLEAVKLEPENISANYNLATVFLQQENFKEAEVYFRKVIRLDKKHLLGLYGLGETLRFQRQFAEAEEVLHQALQLEGSAADILSQLGLVYEEWGKKTEAIEYYKRAIDLIPNFSVAREGLERLGEGNYEPELPNHRQN